MTTRGSLLSAASLILLGNLISRVLGLVREQVIAALFGETAVASAFGTAATVPTIFYDLVVGGAVSAALVPVLSGYAASEDQDDLGEIVGTLLVGAAIVLGTLVALLVLAAVPLTAALGVTRDNAIWATTVGLIRLVIPALLFLGLSGVVAAVCYARRRFIYPAFSVALFNGGLVASALLLHQRLGANSLALGVLLGAACQLVGVVPGLRGIPIRLTFQPRHPAIRQILRLYAPVAGGLIISEIGVLIDRNLAWQTGEASVATMRYATTLIQLPLGLVGTAMSLAALPTLSRLVDDVGEFRRTLLASFRLALLAIAPAAAFLAVFAAPVVRLIFERGAFDPLATAATTGAFLLYAPQLPFVAVDQLLIYAFYARRDTVTPMLVGLGGVGLYLVTALTLIYPFRLGLAGLVLANTVQNSLHAVILFVLLRRPLETFGDRRLAGAILRTAGAAVVAGGVGLVLRTVVIPPPGTAALALYLGVGGALVLGVYGGALFGVRVEEAKLARTLAQEWLAGRRRLKTAVGAGGGT